MRISYFTRFASARCGWSSALRFLEQGPFGFPVPSYPWPHCPSLSSTFNARTFCYNGRPYQLCSCLRTPVRRIGAPTSFNLWRMVSGQTKRTRPFQCSGKAGDTPRIYAFQGGSEGPNCYDCDRQSHSVGLPLDPRRNHEFWSPRSYLSVIGSGYRVRMTSSAIISLVGRMYLPTSCLGQTKCSRQNRQCQPRCCSLCGEYGRARRWMRSRRVSTTVF